MEKKEKNIIKVKIFDYSTRDEKEMEENINSFIKDKKVIDIKYATAGENCSYWVTALVIYKRK